MNKTINQYINQLHLDPKREAAVRKLINSLEESPEVYKLVEALTIKPKYEFVDLGLPSGIKWATCNVGANSPEEFGLYFAFGETEGYSGITSDKGFYWGDYKYSSGQTSSTSTSFKGVTKYNTKSVSGTVDNLTTLEQVDDAAYTSDKTCRMPTKSDFEELIANTTSTWEVLNGVGGRRFTSKTNGNSIFVPVAGDCGNGSASNVGSNGYLWSSSLDESYPRYGWCLNFNSDYVGVGSYYRYEGLTVRAVQEANITSEPNLFNPADYVTKTELDKTVKQLTIKSFVSTILASDASNEDIINKINELINGLISIGIINNEN